MCGLVGIFGNTSFVDHAIFKEMLVASSLRGPHSTGVGIVLKRKNARDRVDFMKMAGNPYELFEANNVHNWLYKNVDVSCVVMGHNRWATTGKITNKNAHPFLHRHIMLAHNGVIRNHRFISKQNFDVDSEHIAHLMAEIGEKETLKKVEGDFCFTWFNEKTNTFNIVRNSKRPIYIAKADLSDKWYYASEKELLQWICYRNNVVIEEPWMPAAGELIKFNPDEPTKITKERVDLAEDSVKDYSQHYHGPYNYHNKFTRYDDYEDYYPAANDIPSERKKAEEKPRVTTKVYNESIMKGREYLAKYSLEKNGKIKVFCGEFTRYDKSAPEKTGGKCKGVFMGDNTPDCEIEVHGMNLDMFYPKNFPAIKMEDKQFIDGYFVCSIGTCWYDVKENKYVLSLFDPKKFEYDLHSHMTEPTLSESSKSPDTKEPLKALPAPANEDAKEDSSGSSGDSNEFVCGPYDTLIEKSKWHLLTKFGCGECGKDLSLDEHGEVVWYGDSPLCPTCGKMYDAAMKSIATQNRETASHIH